MIDRQHGHIVIECNSCDEVFDSGTDDFAGGMGRGQARRMAIAQDCRRVASRLSEMWGANMITRIEINFAQPIELTNDDQQQLVKIAAQICERYGRLNPHRVMWPFGIGLKPTFIPMTAEQERERGIEFDEGVFEIECYERENYDFSCTKCGKPQGDHSHCIVDPPAGDCEFSHQQ